MDNGRYLLARECKRKDTLRILRKRSLLQPLLLSLLIIPAAYGLGSASRMVLGTHVPASASINTPQKQIISAGTLGFPATPSAANQRQPFNSSARHRIYQSHPSRSNTRIVARHIQSKGPAPQAHPNQTYDPSDLPPTPVVTDGADDGLITQF